MERPGSIDSASLRSVKRSFTVLELLNTFPNARLSELARLTDQSRSSVQRSLNKLIELGYVFKEDSSKKYRVTNRVLNLSGGYDLSSVIASASEQIVQNASRKISWPLILTRPRGTDFEVLVTTQDQNPYAIEKLGFGDRVPFFESASGRVFLAHSTTSIRKGYFNKSAQMGLDRGQLAAVKEAVKLSLRQGFAFYQKEKDREKAMAVPVMVGTHCQACLVARFFGSALTERNAVKELLPTLEATAADIGDEISRFSVG